MTVNIGTVSGGTADNIVPDKCLLTGEIRSYSDTEAKEKLESIFAVFRNATEKFGGVRRNMEHCALPGLQPPMFLRLSYSVSNLHVRH
jgi:tripeptide aminopeptidase